MGLVCALYLLKEDNNNTKAVLAYRGTSGILGALSNYEIAIGRMPSQSKDALPVASRAKGLHKDLTLTGHSLGGALAIIAGFNFNLPVVTFNAPGVKIGCFESSLSRLTSGYGIAAFFDTVKNCAVGNNVKNISLNYDIVSTSFLP